MNQFEVTAYYGQHAIAHAVKYAANIESASEWASRMFSDADFIVVEPA